MGTAGHRHLDAMTSRAARLLIAITWSACIECIPSNSCDWERVGEECSRERLLTIRPITPRHISHAGSLEAVIVMTTSCGKSVGAPANKDA